jgi:hypothetical protein
MAVGPIRLHVYTNYISSDPYQCTSAGQVLSGLSESNYTCLATDVVDTALRNTLTNTIIPAVVDVVESVLHIDQVAGNLFLSDVVRVAKFSGSYACRPSLNLPSAWFAGGGGTGIPNSDFAVLFSVRPIPESPYTIANALACNYDGWDGSHYGRPLAGSINLAPSRAKAIDLSNEFAFKNYIRHALLQARSAPGAARLTLATITSELEFMSYFTLLGLLPAFLLRTKTIRDHSTPNRL